MKALSYALTLLLAVGQQPATIDTIDQIDVLLKQLRVALTPVPPVPIVPLLPSGTDVNAAITAGPVGATYQLVSGGTYAPIVLNKNGVRLLGAPVTGRATPTGPHPVVSGLDRLLTIPAGVTGVSVSGIEWAGVGGGADLIMAYGSDYTLDGNYIHGDAALGQKRGIALNGDHGTVTRNYISDIKRQGQDTQAVGSCDGDGAFTIVDNYLEAAGENIMFGGCDPTVPNRIATGIRIARNTIAKPIGWQGLKWSVKNLLELKNAQDVVIEDNDFSNSWAAAQAGYAIALTVRNQDGKCPWCTVERVIIRKNRIAHVNGFLNILGRDDVNPSGVMADILVADNSVDDLNTSAFGNVGNPARVILIQGGPTKLRIERTVVTASGLKVPNSFLVFDQPQFPLVGFAFTGNTMPQGGYGIVGGGIGFGQPVLDAYTPGYVWETNTVIKTGTAKATIKYPAGTIVQ